MTQHFIYNKNIKSLDLYRKSVDQNLHKNFSSKNLCKVSDEIQRRSSEEWDLVKIFTKNIREIPFFRRSQKRFGSWVSTFFQSNSLAIDRRE